MENAANLCTVQVHGDVGFEAESSQGSATQALCVLALFEWLFEARRLLTRFPVGGFGHAPVS